MTFTDRLCTLPIDRLKEIVRRRAFHIRAVPRITTRHELCAWMAKTLSDAYAIRRAFEETNILQARLLTFVIAQGGEMGREMVAEHVSEEVRDRLDEASDGLEALGLAIRVPDGESWRLWVPDSVRAGIPLPLPLRHKLQPTLERYDSDTLHRLVQHLGITTTGVTTKAARSAAIARKLLDPDSLQQVLDGLTDEARSVLDFVLRRGGVTNLHELGLRLDTRRRNQLYSYDWSYRWYAAEPRNPVEELLSRGLLVLEGSVGFHYGAILIAGDLLEKLTGQSIFSGEIPPEPAWEIVPATGAALRTHDSLCRDVAYLLGYLSRNPTGRTGKGIIHRTALKNIARSLTFESVAYSSFLYAISREAGLIDTTDRDENYSLTPDGDAWLQSGHAEQVAILYSAWRRQLAWVETKDDLLVDDTVYVEPEGCRSIRSAVIDLAAEFAKARTTDLVTRQSLTARARYRRWASFPPDAAPLEATEDGRVEKVNRSDVEEAITASELVFRVLLALHWLGLAAVADSQTERFALFRLTDRGRVLLLHEPATESDEAVASFVVQPNLEVYTPPNLTAELYYGLFRFADPKSGGILSLSRESLRKAMDRGMTTSSILDFLRTHSSSGLPQNVEYLVREVGGKHGHIRVGTAGLYIVVDDPILLKELAAQTKLSIRVRKQLADTVALVTGESVDAVLKQLRQAGYLPVADREEKPAVHRRAAYRQSAHEERESAAAILAAIDWDRLARGADGPAPASTGQPPAVNEPGAIRAAVEMALKNRRRLQYASSPSPMDDEIVTAEPVGLAGSLLRAYLPQQRHFRIINLSQMQWVRVTAETFTPRKEPANLSTAGE